MNVAAALKLNIFYLVILLTTLLKKSMKQQKNLLATSSDSFQNNVFPMRHGCTGCVRTTRLEIQISVPVLEVIKSRTLWRVGTSAKDA
ncbi:hypothetical protein GQX74_004924 [Glossina fuscipes]|nr:hypothetical protein GQX74_004924 [Glossina fuscipes]